MAFLREPIVRLIAVTHFQKPDDLQEFQIWQTDTDNEPQQLIEASGRVCYDSFSNPSGRTNEQYIANLLSQGHMSVIEHAVASFYIKGISRACCYDSETEVLTSAGWKRFWEVSDHDEVATLEPETGRLIYLRPEEYYEFDYEGLMYCVRNRAIDLLVTPDHRLLVCRFDTRRRRRGIQEWELLPAAEIVGKRVEYKRDAKWYAHTPPFVEIPQVSRPSKGSGTRAYGPLRLPTIPFAKFLGYFLSEGHLHHTEGSSYEIVLTQNPGKVLDDMIATIQQMGFRPSLRRDPHEGSKAIWVRFYSLPLFNWLRENAFINGEKCIPQIAKSWGTEALQALWDGLVAGDGSVHCGNGHVVFYTTSKRLSDDVQELALKLGLSASIRQDDRVGQVSFRPAIGRFINHNKVCYIVSVHRQSCSTPLVNHNGYRHDGWVPYRGKVYCLKVPTGVLYVRRNGKPVWCGNSHEIVRHRHFSYSQRSTRYVDESDCNFIVPDCIADDPEAMRIFAEAVTKAQEAYRQLYELLREKFADVEDRTLRRKLARQAARMVLPNATETALVMTGNFRAWRHFIRMRASEHADVEIRKVAVKVLKELQKVAPAVFGDFQIRQLPDGTEAAEPGYLWE
jgi:thymidylate synthase ThyX